MKIKNLLLLLILLGCFDNLWTMQVDLPICVRPLFDIANESDENSVSQPTVLHALVQLLFVMSHYEDSWVPDRRFENADRSFFGLEQVVSEFSVKNKTLCEFFRKKKMFSNIVLILEVMGILRSAKVFKSLNCCITMGVGTRKHLYSLTDDEILSQLVTINPILLADKVEKILFKINEQRGEDCLPQVVKTVLCMEGVPDYLERIRVITRGETQAVVRSWTRFCQTRQYCILL